MLGWATATRKMSESTVQSERRRARARSAELIKENQLSAAIEVLTWLDVSAERHDRWHQQSLVRRLTTLPPPETRMPYTIDDHSDW